MKIEAVSTLPTFEATTFAREIEEQKKAKKLKEIEKVVREKKLAEEAMLAKEDNSSLMNLEENKVPENVLMENKDGTTDVTREKKLQCVCTFFNISNPAPTLEELVESLTSINLHAEGVLFVAV
jgi:hypothetical protein